MVTFKMKGKACNEVFLAGGHCARVRLGYRQSLYGMIGWGDGGVFQMCYAGVLH